ncbi:MAG: hypothetical protein MZW92_55520 [Comamonadaceae bacterium]|nr:hypothetical protein [Comamonadaceae bacterium]
MLIGATGQGRQAATTRSTSPTRPRMTSRGRRSPAKVLWEFTSASTGVKAPRLHLSASRPSSRRRKYGWVADPRLPATTIQRRPGLLLRRQPAHRRAAREDRHRRRQHRQRRRPGARAGLHPRPRRRHRRRRLAGDLLGNLWRLDLRGSGTYSATKIAELLDSSGNALPVTTRPLVVVQPETNIRFVTVGTGRLLASSDKSSQQRQGFFAIKDGTGNAPGTSAQLPRGVSWPVDKTDLQADGSDEEGRDRPDEPGRLVVRPRSRHRRRGLAHDRRADRLQRRGRVRHDAADRRRLQPRRQQPRLRDRPRHRAEQAAAQQCRHRLRGNRRRGRRPALPERDRQRRVVGRGDAAQRHPERRRSATTRATGPPAWACGA